MSEHRRMTNRAHALVRRELAAGRPVNTPFGPMTARPERCQCCQGVAVPVVSGGPNAGTEYPALIAHHYDGYGTREKDLSVMFVCRSCHGELHRQERLAAERRTQGVVELCG